MVHSFEICEIDHARYSRLKLELKSLYVLILKMNLKSKKCEYSTFYIISNSCNCCKDRSFMTTDPKPKEKS